MALTVVSKPSGFQPVGGPSLLYQFTEASVVGKPNYRVELEFNGLFSGLKFEFRPTAALAIDCEISKILYSALTLSTLTTDRLKSTYVKYQAVWNGGSDAVVSLTTDVIYAYVGINHALNARTKFDIRSSDSNASAALATGVFLRYGNQDFVNERTHTIEFLCDGSLPVNAKFFFRIDTVNWAAPVVFDGTVKTMYSFDIALTAMGPVEKSFVEVFVTNNAVSLYYGYLTGYCYPECKNPVFLRWINDYGGIQDRMFDINQSLTLSPRVSKKLKILTLYADLLTYQQWLMLNELLRTSDIYNDDYKVGLFLQDVTNAAAPLNLITLEDDSNTVNTYAKGYPISFRVKYPTINYN